MALYDDLEAAIDAIGVKYSEAMADGKLSFSEIWALFQNGIATLVQVAQKYSDLSGAEKKQAVLQALGTLYDRVIEPIDIKGVPNFLEGIVDGALKQLMLSLADPAIDSLVNIFNKTGWGDSDTPTTTTGEEPSGPQAPPDFVPY